MGRPKGSRNQPHGESPVTARLCELHYKTLCGRAERGELDIDQLMALVRWEHAEMYGKPREKVDLSVSGGLTVSVHIE